MVDRIAETLAEHLSKKALFLDIDDIEPGSNFPAVIRQRLQDCHVVLVFIGREWLTVKAGGHRRLDDPSDQVRLEVQTALALPNTRVIPVLVKNAVMPKVDELPVCLSQLAVLNAITIRSRNPDYKQDMTALVEAVRQGIIASAAERIEAAEREEMRRGQWAAQGTGPLPQPLDAQQWERLLVAIEAGAMVVVCGSELGTNPKIGEPVSRESPLAERVANTLGLPVPPREVRRPLAQLAVRCQQEGRQEEFARAMRSAADALPPTGAAGLQALRNIEPLRLFLTSSLDRGLEAALERPSTKLVASIAYTPAKPLGLDDIDLSHIPTLVFHVTGSASGFLGDAVVTGTDWRYFADAWRERQPAKLPELFEDKNLLFLGGGHPAGFVEFWIELAARLHCLSFWIGSSLFAHDPALAGFLRESAGRQQILFDDSGDPTFLSELALRWAATPAAKSPPVAAQVGGPSAEKPMSVGMQVESDGERGESGQRDEHPWPGLVPFREGQNRSLFGREEEVRLLVRAIRFHPVTLLFARSGMGKTSLLRAGVVPGLRARGVVPVVLRIHWAPGAPPLRIQVLQAVTAEATFAGITLPDLDSAASLWEFFHHRNVAPPSDGDGQSRFALVFDQFEEFFTLGATTPDLKESALAAWRELADLVEGRIPSTVRQTLERDESAVSEYNLRSPAPPVLLSLREEFLPQMESLGRDMPSLNRSRFRLLGLSRQQALAVVLRAGPGIFTEEAAHALIDSLASGSPIGVAATEHVFESVGVHAAILGLLCFELNQKRLALRLPHVDLRLLQQTSGKWLKSFYEDAVADFSPALRHWVEDELVTEGGYRDSISLDRAWRDLANRGVPPSAIDTLVDRRLLSVFEIQGIRRVELVHDMLLPIVVESRASRDRAKTTRSWRWPGF